MLENPAPPSWKFPSLMIIFSTERSSDVTIADLIVSLGVGDRKS